MATTDDGFIRNFEDYYDGDIMDSFEELRDYAEAFWLDSFLSRWNIPVWINYDAMNEQENPAGPTIQVGCIQSRKGNTIIHIAPCTPEQHQELAAIIMRVWIGRAETQFMRYPPIPEMNTDYAEAR